VLRSDRDAPAHEYFPNLDAAADVFVLDRSRGVVDSAGLTGPLALSRQFEPESTLTEMTPAWSRDGQALFAFEDGPSGGADRLVRHDFPAPPADPTPMASTRLVERVASHSIDADPNDPPLDPGTERDTCEGVGLPSALDRRALAVVAECFQEQVVIGLGSLRVWEQVGPRVHRIRIASVAAGPNGDGELEAEYTGRFDFGARQLAPCAGASCAAPGAEPAGEENASEPFPSLSPDGAQLSFVRPRRHFRWHRERKSDPRERQHRAASLRSGPGQQERLRRKRGDTDLGRHVARRQPLQRGPLLSGSSAPREPERAPSAYAARHASV